MPRRGRAKDTAGSRDKKQRKRVRRRTGNRWVSLGPKQLLIIMMLLAAAAVRLEAEEANVLKTHIMKLLTKKDWFYDSAPAIKPCDDFQRSRGEKRHHNSEAPISKMTIELALVFTMHPSIVHM